MTATITIPAGRRWAYLGAALGGFVSIAANIAHSYVPPAGVGPEWTPKSGAVFGAVFWPVALFVATEILTRVAWPAGRVWWLLRWTGMLPVAVVAALVSYRHLSGLLAFYGEEPLICVLGPVAVDGLMVMATGAILATGQHPYPHTESSVSVPAVPDPVRPPAPISPAVPAPSAPAPDVPAGTSPSATTPVPVKAPAVRPETRPEPELVPESLPTPAQVAPRITPPPTLTAPAPSAARSAAAGTVKPRPRKASTGPAPRPAAPATDTPVTAPEPAPPLPSMPVPADLVSRARTVAGQYRTEHGTPITPGQLAVRLKVTTTEATQALAVLDLGPDSPTRPQPTVNGRPVRTSR